MATLTKNSAISQAVGYCGFFLMCAGILLEPTRSLYCVGSTLVWSGMIQSYYGSVFESEAKDRGRWILLGVPLCLLFLYTSYGILVENLADAYWISAVVVAVIAIQVFVSLIAMQIWNRKSLQVSRLKNLDV